MAPTDPPERSLTDRILDVVAELLPTRAGGAPDDGDEDSALSELTSRAERALLGWAAERLRGRAGLERGLDRLAAAGRPLELSAQIDPGTPVGLEVAFFIDGAHVGSGRTSELGAAVCAVTAPAIGLHVIASELRADDGTVLVPAQPIAHLQVVGDGPVVVADARLLDDDVATVAAVVRALATYGVTVCWAELADVAGVAARHAQLADAGLPAAAVLALGARERDFATLGVDFGLVNAQLLVRRLRAAGVPLVAALTTTTTVDAPAAVGLLALTVPDLVARLATGAGLPELWAAAVAFVDARDDVTGPAALTRRLDLMTATRAVAGHAIEIELDNRAARAALFADLERATRSIHLQFYILKPGRFATELVERLRARGRAGVAVRLVVDALYAGHDLLGRTNPVVAELLDQPGIEIVASDPITLGGLDRVALKQRDHRKLAIIDGEVAYVTGRNGADEYYLGFDEVEIDDATPHDAIPWLDAHARVRGPLVAELQRVFVANWRRNGGPTLARADLGAPAPVAGDVLARVITHDGIDDARALASYDALFAGARARIVVVNDFPVIADLAMRLIAAAQRGVQVDVLTGNGLARRGDGTFFAGPRHRELFEYMVKHRYEPLLAAGVRVAEYAAPAWPTITATGGRIRPYVHAKVVVVDGCVASVGTANLDATASHWEREVNLVIESPTIAAALTAQLDELLAQAHTIDPTSAAWRREAPHRAVASRLWPDRLYS
ncbi:MAG: phosphatidylserine/phosphatidylglycerophosphate/cardiolipin synthase family protein [Myxococcales bacterium]|nr:phosphatidylserine/phosphatidylglycerophosphate/cardiolipin synthase family protein [Myxococcales bacterium]